MSRHNPVDPEQEHARRNSPQPSPLQLLLKAIDADNLCRSPNGRIWVARNCGEETADVVPLRGAQLRDYVFNSAFQDCDSFPSPAIWRHALHCWQSIARRLNVNPALRVSGDGLARIILDADGGRDALTTSIQILPDGWTLHNYGPGAFYRPASSRRLPHLEWEPLPAFHSLQPLRRLFRCAARADWHRIVVWLLSVLRPHGPYPILVLQGPSGSGKTCAARMLRSLIDPAVSPLLPLPATERRLHAQALDNYILAYDHVTSMPTRLSDMFSRLATGATTYIHDSPQDLQRPILLTVPDHAAWTPSPDLASRILVVNLAQIPKHQQCLDAEMEEKFKAAHNPAIRILCDAIVQALACQKQAGRPSDCETWATSAAPILSLTGQDVTEALSPVGTQDPLIPQLADLLAHQPDGRWRGTPTALLECLPEAARPQSASHLSMPLGKIAASLESQGIEIVRTKVKGNSRISLRRHLREKSPTPPHPTPQVPRNPKLRSIARDPSPPPRRPLSTAGYLGTAGIRIFYQSNIPAPPHPEARCQAPYHGPKRTHLHFPQI